MISRKSFGRVLVMAIALPTLAVVANGCSAAQDAQQAASGCSGLSATASSAQATILAWSTALGELNTAATDLEAKWLSTCNEMNKALNLDSSQTDAGKACGVLQAYIKADLAAGVTLSLVVAPGGCQADVSIEAQCEADAKCTVTPATCTGGTIEVGCDGSCSAECDVTGGSATCTGSCEGECSASAAVQCTGTCTGTCDAPTWTGTCDAGCSATFAGSCGGNCTGSCKASGGTTQVTGAACAGTCTGTCDAKASGSCAAKCSGNFSGGTCSGSCTGKCNVSAGASCSGTCNGTCKITTPSASCKGECKGTCSATTTPPTCSGGSLNCAATASCQGQASAKLVCSPPQVTVTVTGDAQLLAAYQQFSGDIGTAINKTLTLKDPITKLAGETISTFQALGDVGVGGVSCVAAQASVAASASASINVSVSASASVSGSAG